MFETRLEHDEKIIGGYQTKHFGHFGGIIVKTVEAPDIFESPDLDEHVRSSEMGGNEISADQLLAQVEDAVKE